MHPFLTVALVNAAYRTREALAPAAAREAIGIPTAFAALVVFFTTILVLMVLVGHLRDRRRQRR